MNNTIAISISKGQISTFPTVHFNGHITVIEDHETALGALEYLNKQQMTGFDTETKPSFRKGLPNKVALIQIATEEQCFLFRINKLGFIPELRQFIENDDITKIGLSLKDDFSVLHRVADFTPGGFIELQSYVKQFNISDISLQKIYGIIFEERISKSQRLSNWEATQLSSAQQTYAAIDAWACMRIYKHLNAGLFDPAQSPYITQEQNITEELDEI